MTSPTPTFADLIDFDRLDDDVFVAVSATYPWGRVYGGQVIAQAAHAALATVDARYRLHSLHGYFIRGGSSDETIRFDVDRIRDGRSFVTRRVVASQSPGAICNVSASFQMPEGDLDLSPSAVPDTIPGPEDLSDSTWDGLLERRLVPADAFPGGAAAWLRVRGPHADARVDQVALAFASDDVPYDAAAALRPDYDMRDADGRFVGASLDHAIWFHRDGPADDWQLHLHRPLNFAGNRGLAHGQVFDRSGRHLASVAQEIVLRRRGSAD